MEVGVCSVCDTGVLLASKGIGNNDRIDHSFAISDSLSELWRLHKQYETQCSQQNTNAEFQFVLKVGVFELLF
jgi:hypothetical protein